MNVNAGRRPAIISCRILEITARTVAVFPVPGCPLIYLIHGIIGELGGLTNEIKKNGVQWWYTIAMC